MGTSPFTHDINNTNEFIGVGLVGGVSHGFVGQIEAPEPSTLILLGIAFLSFLGWRRLG